MWYYLDDIHMLYMYVVLPNPRLQVSVRCCGPAVCTGEPSFWSNGASHRQTDGATYGSLPYPSVRYSSGLTLCDKSINQ